MIGPVTPGAPRELRPARPERAGATEQAAKIAAPQENPVGTRAASDLAEQAPIDTSRVAELRARIADGSYKADAAAIANKLLGR